jgi:cytochrome b561
MAACYLVLFVVGKLMSELSDEVSFREALYDFHKSLGVLVIGLLTWRILVLLRVWWRKYTKRLPKFTPSWFRTFALHFSLYIFMWAVPVSGVFLSNSYQSHNVSLFGIGLPDFFPQNKAVLELGRNLHFWFAYTFLAFIILHAIAQWKVIRANWRRFLGFINRIKNPG